MADLSIAESRELTNKITSATSIEDIRSALMDAAQSQGLVKIQDGSFVLAPEKEAATGTISRTEKIGGRDVVFSASTPLELEQQIGAALRAEAATHNGTTDTKSESYTAGQDAFQRAELELKFKRGEISTTEYLDKSNAVSEYLQAAGVDPSIVGNIADGKVYEADWATATQRFLESPEGRDWPGGQENLALMGQTLQRLGLQEANDKFAAFTQAWDSMKKVRNYVPFVETASEDTRDSEVATPEELVDAWKRSLAAQGLDEGTAFTAAFSRSKNSSAIFGH